jgi:curli biogenesis system outer membrane secretion channel CsgG
LSDAVKVPMVAMMISVCLLGPPIAASMAMLGPRAIDPQPARSQAQRRTAKACYFDFRQECRAFAAGEKSRA